MILKNPYIRTTALACLTLALLACSTMAKAGSVETTKRKLPAYAPAPLNTPFDGDGMWIWIASKSNGGNPTSIARRAKRSGIETVYLKSGDGGNYWSQFSPAFVSALKELGLRVCAWQYVYGTRPATEARVAARAVRNGAECFVIDAEAEYEGHYAAARTYMRRLRRAVGDDYPIGLAGFPYVHYHPSFPYSVFLGPGGAQFNLPQMYWKAIGVSVRSVYSTTYRYNLPYKRPIRPLGQTYMNPGSSALRRFRELGLANGAGGVSWWDWQSSRSRHWRAIGRKLRTNVQVEPHAAYVTLRRGSRGDLVIWAQGYLRAAGFQVPVTGYFRSSTARAVTSFRVAHGLSSAPVIDQRTWTELLKEEPTTSSFLRRRPRASAKSASMGEPQSARLAARRYEIPPKH